jgi:hypothetical protein
MNKKMVNVGIWSILAMMVSVLEPSKAMAIGLGLGELVSSGPLTTLVKYGLGLGALIVTLILLSKIPSVLKGESGVSGFVGEAFGVAMAWVIAANWESMISFIVSKSGLQ